MGERGWRGKGTRERAREREGGGSPAARDTHTDCGFEVETPATGLGNKK